MAQFTKRKDGRYQTKIYLGFNDDGKAKYKYVYAPTQRELKKKSNELLAKYNKGIELDADNDSFSSLSEKWLSSKEIQVSTGALSEKRYRSYKAAANHLNRTIGDYSIGKIKTSDIQIVIDKLTVINPSTKRPSSKETLRSVRMSAKQIFDLAIVDRIIDYNPALYVKIPSNAPKATKRALTEEEQQWIIDTHHRAKPAAMIMLFSGLRRGELIPLTWSDIDLQKNIISVNKAVKMVSSRPVIKSSTKSDAGNRTIPIPTILSDYLKELKNDSTSLLVFPSVKGTMLTETGWKRLWSSYLTDLNLKYGDFSELKKRPKSKYEHDIPFVITKFTAHWLRHTYATMLYLADVDVLTAQKLLGHTKVQTTLDIYTHLDEIYKDRSIDKLEKYLDRVSDRVSDIL